MSIITNKISGGGLSFSETIKVNCEAQVSIEDFVYIDNLTGQAKRAIATSQDKSIVTGIVIKKYSSNECLVQLMGKVKLSNYVLSPGKYYYLSGTSEGKMQPTDPNASGIVSKRLGKAITTEYLMLELSPPGLTRS